jgi:hypothetical protein
MFGTICWCPAEQSWPRGTVVGTVGPVVWTSANPPRRCRNGHVLGPWKVLVSFTHCECSKVKPRSVGHTTWKCRTCDAVIYADDAGFFT